MNIDRLQFTCTKLEWNGWLSSYYDKDEIELLGDKYLIRECKVTYPSKNIFSIEDNMVEIEIILHKLMENNYDTTRKENY